MPLKSNIETEEFQVYFCTRARRELSVNFDVRQETCFLRSLSMFFCMQRCHVEDVKHIKIPNQLKSITQVFIYHVTSHNLRSQIFRKQLLAHLESNVCAVFLREAELDFTTMYSFFLSGCTIEVKAKLKNLHEKATVVYDGCYETATIELISKLKKLEERSRGCNLGNVHTFPIIYNNAVATFTFDLAVKDVNIESVTNVSGLNKIAVKLRKNAPCGSRGKSEMRKLDKSTELLLDQPSIPLSVAGVELKLRKTVIESRHSLKLNKQCNKDEQKECNKELHCTSATKSVNKGLCKDVLGSKNGAENKLDKLGIISDPTDLSRISSYSLFTASSSASASTPISSLPLASSSPSLLPSPLSDPKSSSTSSNICSLLEEGLISPMKMQRSGSVEEVNAKEIGINSNAFDSDYKFNLDLKEYGQNSFENEFTVKQSKTYAVSLPGKWSESGERLICIKFPEEHNQLKDMDHMKVLDFPCSGYSTPSTFNLSEEYKSPIDSPLVCLQHQKQVERRRVYPEPCPVYSLEASFPPVSFPAEFST